MPKLLVKWIHSHDPHVCDVCRELGDSGYVWTLESGQEIELVYKGKTVWTIGQGSDAHGAHDGSCRCTLDFDFDFSDLIAPVKRLHDRFCGGEQVGEVPKL